MSDVALVVRTADKTRKAEIKLSRSNTGGDVMQAAVDNWKLPVDVDYSLVNTTTGSVISSGQALSNVVVSDGDVLEVQPVLVAG